MTDHGPPIDDDALARALLDFSPDGLLLVGPDGRILLANPAAARIFGLEQHELVGLGVERLVPEEQRDRHARLRTRFSDAPESRPMGSGLRLFGQHADGSLFPVEISLGPVDIGGEVHTIAAVRDVSEREEDHARVALMEERGRIARDLHDMVIQRLFAAGLTLQAVDTTDAPTPVAERIAATIDELDETISEIRRAIFHLGQSEELSLEVLLERLVDERVDDLGFRPDLVIEGDIDAVPRFVTDQLVTTLREGLSNMVRHAGATSGLVAVVARADSVELTIEDDGVGLPPQPKHGGGITNMMWRAAELGGECTICRNEPAGTRLDWRVPL